jgi:hypothetical protein
MSDRRPRGSDADRDPAERQLEQRLRSWLDTEPDQPSDTLAASTITRARRSRQRPAWQARLLQGGWGTNMGAGPRRTLGRLAVGSGTILAAGLVAVLAWRVAMPPTDPGASNRPTGVAATTEPATAAASASGLSTSPPASASVPFDGRAESVRVLEDPATALGSGFGSLWLGDEAGRLLRIDPGSGSVVATIELGAVPCGPVLPVATSIWLTTCGDGITSAGSETVRVDPETNAIAGTYPGGGGDGIGISAMNGLVWFVSDVQAGTLTAVDAVTGERVRDLSVDAPVRFLTAGFGSLWVSPIGRPAVLRLDPVTGREQAAIALSGDAGYLVTSVDSIWVAEPHQWVVGRIDPALDRLSAEFGAPMGVGSLTVADSGSIWTLGDTGVLAIDPDASPAADQFSVPAHIAFDAVGTHVLALIGSSAWFADRTELLRIDPR